MEETKDRTDETIETTDTTEKTENEKKAVSQENDGQKNSSPKKIEHYCAMCRRPESIAGKMVEMPNHMYVCPDCMQRMFDLMHSSGFPYQNMMNVTNMEDLMNFKPDGDSGNHAGGNAGAGGSTEKRIRKKTGKNDRKNREKIG